MSSITRRLSESLGIGHDSVERFEREHVNTLRSIVYHWMYSLLYRRHARCVVCIGLIDRIFFSHVSIPDSGILAWFIYIIYYIDVQNESITLTIQYQIVQSGIDSIDDDAFFSQTNLSLTLAKSQSVSLFYVNTLLQHM